jgi:hypothetical protein
MGPYNMLIKIKEFLLKLVCKDPMILIAVAAKLMQSDIMINGFDFKKVDATYRLKKIILEMEDASVPVSDTGGQFTIN